MISRLCRIIKRAMVLVLAIMLVLTSSLPMVDSVFAGDVAYAAEDTVTLSASLTPVNIMTTDKVLLTVSINDVTSEALSGIQMRIKYPEEFDIIQITDLDFFENGISFFGEEGANPMYCSFGSHGTEQKPSDSTTKKKGDLVTFEFEANQLLDVNKRYEFSIEKADESGNNTLEAFVLTTDEEGNPYTRYLNVIDDSSSLSYFPAIPGGSVGDGNQANLIEVPHVTDESAVMKYVIKQQAVKKALESDKDIVIMTKSTAPVSEPKAEIVLSKKSAKLIGSEEKSLTMQTDAGQLLFSHAAIQNIGERDNGDNLIISVRKIDSLQIGESKRDAVDFEVTAALVDDEGKNPVSVTEFGGGEVEISLPLPDALQGKDVKCWNYTDTNYTMIDGSMKGTQYVFKTNHFSNYIIAEQDTLEAFKEEKNLNEGAKLSGTATSWNGTDDAIYRLYPGTTADADIKADIKLATSGIAGAIEPSSKGTIVANADGKRSDQTFSFEAIADGTYKLAVYKPGGYVITIKTIDVATADVTENVELWLLGDVNMDGKINGTDALWVRQHVAETRTLLEIQRELADVNGDSKVNGTDALWIRQYVAEIRDQDFKMKS